MPIELPDLGEPSLWVENLYYRDSLHASKGLPTRGVILEFKEKFNFWNKWSDVCFL